MSDLIGKKIYKMSRYGIDSLLGEIDHETKTTALVRGNKFRKPASEHMSMINGDNWSIYYYSIETPELNEKFEKKKMVETIKSALSKYNIEDSLPMDALTLFYNSIIKPVKP